ncbi:hypothetical protein ACOSQ2_018345 [Xanthoceras sorbifolium]
MASEAESIEISSLFDRLLRHRDMSLFLPFILGFTNMSRRENSENQQDPDQETLTNASDRIILINPFTQGMVVIEGTSSLDSMLRNLATKDGQPPASKASVEAMPSFKIGESEDGEMGECVICLEEYETGEMAKEMPCKHRFHDKCIDKWLGIHGSCPVCRYTMPVDEENTDSKRDHEQQRREIWVSFSINSGSRSGGDSNQTQTATSTESTDDVSSSPISRPNQEMDG